MSYYVITSYGIWHAVQAKVGTEPDGLVESLITG